MKSFKRNKINKQVKKVLNNKTVHIEMPGEIHKKLRVKLFLDELSIQQFFRLVAEKYAEDDNYIKQIVLERVDEIKNNKLNRLKEINEKDLYNAIEENSPFKNN